MRNLLRTLAVVVAAVPALASAVITNSKHDLASGSSAAVKTSGATVTDQTCIFCHTPHKASTSLLLWNHTMSANTGWTAATTLAGTPLPAAVQDASKRCLSCHDGTVALGDVMNSSGAAQTFTMTGGTGAGNAFMTVASTIGAGGLETNHPVSVPYPAGAGGNTYAAIASSANVADFRAVNAATCTSTTGICTTAPVAADGAKINLYGTAAAPGIECGSCHEVHNNGGNAYFLRVSTAGSAICIACHVK
jgi:predicted CXXCH cytochrome family protein